MRAILTLPDLPPKGDVSNWIEAGGTAEDWWALEAQATEWRETGAAQPGAGDQQGETSNDSKHRNGGARPTQAQTLIDIATGDGVDLYHSPDGTTYADIIVNGHRETWPTKSSGFKGWLRRTYYEQTGGAQQRCDVNRNGRYRCARPLRWRDAPCLYPRCVTHGR
jgi:hypothetical protein